MSRSRNGSTRIATTQRSLIQGLHNQQAGVVYWFLPSRHFHNAKRLGLPITIVLKSGQGSLNIERVVQYVYGGLTYDELDAIYTTYNSFLSVSYDDLNPTGSSHFLPFSTRRTGYTNPDRRVFSSLTSNDFG